MVKVPRFTLEKFPQAEPRLTTQMKSVGEAMAIGRTFKEALQKALRSLEIKRFGLCGDGANKDVDAETLRLKLAIPNAERIFYLAQAFQDGMPIDEVFELTKIDRWFLRNVQQIVEEANRLRSSTGILPVGQAGVSPAERENASSGRDPQFHPMDRHREIQKHRRNLPHWEQPDATYFVTFRLADAVPQGILRRWKEEIEAWRKFHPEPWDASTKYEYQKRFQDDREQWLDQGHGKCVLEKADAAAIVVSALRHFDRDRYLLDAFVVMPNHVHVLVQLAKGQALADILHSWKSFSAKAINELLGRKGQLWQDESYDRIVRDWNELVGYRDYILHNPEKAKLREDKFVLEAQRVLHPASDSAGGTPAGPTGKLPVPQLLRAKKLGVSDRQLAVANGVSATEIRTKRQSSGVLPTYRLVDTCAAEFEAYTPYYYSTYGDENERRESGKRRIMILGGGPNRIGQGIEFDYCCVHAAFALRELGFETIMVNSNPETVSTDYDTSDKLYFEPLTLEDVLNIYDQEKPEGVFVQFGGQTPLNLADGLKAAGVPILGTQPESIETAEDRRLFAAMLDKLGLRQTPNGSATSTEAAVGIAKKVGYPVLVRPSFVLGGRAMELVYNEGDLRRYMASAIEVTPDRPVLIDRFLEDAIEVDVDCISDGETTVIGAIMEHIEEAGIHSGDSACVIPPFSLSQKVLDEISAATEAMARELKVRGLMNVQFAVKGDDAYVLEVNPRASRTVPFVSKAIGVPLAKAKIKVTKVFKSHEGRPNVLDRIKNGDINFIINTPSGKIPREHEVVIRNAALAAKIPIMTTVRAALASANGIRSLQKRKIQVRSLQEYHCSGGL